MRPRRQRVRPADEWLKLDAPDLRVIPEELRYRRG